MTARKSAAVRLVKYADHLPICRAKFCAKCRRHISDIRQEVTQCIGHHAPDACSCGLAELLREIGL